MNEKQLTVGGDKFMAEALRSCGPMLEWRRIGNPPPGVPPSWKTESFISKENRQIKNSPKMENFRRCLPGDDAQEGAILIFGVISVLSDKRRLGKAALATRR